METQQSSPDTVNNINPSTTSNTHKCTLSLHLDKQSDTSLFIDSLSIIKEFEKVSVSTEGQRVVLSVEEPSVSKLTKTSHIVLNNSNFIMETLRKLEALEGLQQ